MGKQEIYKGTIRCLVTGESRINVSGRMTYGSFARVYFVIKLEERIGIGGLPDEILVYSASFGYFRKGDKVILKGRIVKEDLKKWDRKLHDCCNQFL